MGEKSGASLEKKQITCVGSQPPFQERPGQAAVEIGQMAELKTVFRRIKQEIMAQVS